MPKGGDPVARRPRAKSESGVYHIMLRGINRQTIFEDDEDREMFIGTVDAFRGDTSYKTYAYCLMDNHVHLLIREQDDSISTIVKKMAASYVYWFNKKYDRFGHLFQGRFKSEVVEDDRYFLTVLRYIHQNPLKAGLARDMDACRWTSYQEYIVKGRQPVVDIDMGLNLFSQYRDKAVAMYIDFHREVHNDKCMDYGDFIRLTDKQVRAVMIKLGYTTTALQHMSLPSRNSALQELKGVPGISLRQLARVTGISKSVIERA